MEDTPLAPNWVRARVVGSIPFAFIASPFLLLVLYTVAAILKLPVHELSTGTLVIALIPCFALYFAFIYWINRKAKRNFYFKCGEEKLETRVGMFNQKIVIIPYGQIVGVWEGKPQVGAGRTLGRTPRGMSVDYDAIFIKEAGQWPRIYGGFTQVDAQRIVDFISKRISPQ